MKGLEVGKRAEQDRARRNVPVIGLDADELRWVRTLVSLLRHPDPIVAELTRHALDYLTESAVSRGAPEVAEPAALDNAG